MIDKNFFFKLMNVFVVAAVIIGYNSVLEARSHEDEMARMEAELQTIRLRMENGQDSDVLEGAYADGVYTGEGIGFGGSISLELVIESGRITDIQILSAEHEDTVYLENARGIIDSIVKQQSADVDTISGATFSSTGIRDAAAEALEKAVR